MDRRRVDSTIPDLGAAAAALSLEDHARAEKVERARAGWTAPVPQRRRSLALVGASLGLLSGLGLGIGVTYMILKPSDVIEIQLGGGEDGEPALPEGDQEAGADPAGKKPEAAHAQPELEPEIPGTTQLGNGGAEPKSEGAPTAPTGAEVAGMQAPAGGSAAPTAPREAQNADDVAERKRLRRALMVAFKEGRYAEASRSGIELRQTFVVDWEAHFTVAEAQRLGNLHAEALESYRIFLKTFPDNAHCDDARFWAAEMLTSLGRRQEAMTLYRQVVDDTASHFRASAAARLNAP